MRDVFLSYFTSKNVFVTKSMASKGILEALPEAILASPRRCGLEEHGCLVGCAGCDPPPPTVLQVSIRFSYLQRSWHSIVSLARIHVTRPTHDAPGLRTGVLSSTQDCHTVNQQVAHSHRNLVGLLKRRPVADRLGIKDDDVGIKALAEQPTVADRQPGGDRRRHLADRVFDGNDAILAHVFAEDASVSAVRAGM